MIKSEIIDRVSEKTLKPKYVCELIINSMIEVIQDALRDEEDFVQLRGLCNFEVAHRKDRKGVDINGNETIFKGGQYIKIKPSDALKRIFE